MKGRDKGNSKVKILFWLCYPHEGQSTRYRVEQYLPYLEAKNISYSLCPFFTSKFYRILYQPDRVWRKFYFFILSSLKRFFNLLKILRYDIVFVQRETFPLGPPFFEILISNFFKKPLIYDFDDAIFLDERSEANKAVAFLKTPQKVSRIIALSKQVIVGNNYLKNYAQSFNRNVTVIPTPLDTEKYKPSTHPEKKEIVLGWIGSHSTAEYLLDLKEVFQRLKKGNPDLVIRLVGAEKYSGQLPGTECLPWSLEDEISELGSFDIGLMPMPDNPWTKGKCAFKLLLYMSMEIPAICSPVGMNKEIITDGENGFFASTSEEWFNKILLLIKNPDLRRKIGGEGRKTVEKKYDLNLWTSVFVEVLEKAIKK